MIKEPGNLSDLNQSALEAWNQKVLGILKKHIKASGSEHLNADLSSIPENKRIPVEWGGFPKRLPIALGTEAKAGKFLDWRDVNGDRGRAIGHEEYLEWHVVRNPQGKIVRAEMTTETREYWEVLAAYHPQTALRVIGRFAGEQQADAMEVYGTNNPLGLSLDDRRKSFVSRMTARQDSEGFEFPPTSVYNNGLKAITFLAKGVNAWEAAAALAAYAAFPYVRQGSTTSLTGAEAIAFTTQSAVDCRNSDPTIVGGLVGLAAKHRKVVFDDPIGLYISAFDRPRLLIGSGGQPITEVWLDFQRGSLTGARRPMRLLIEAPQGSGLTLSDLVDSETDEPITSGAQLAKLAKVVINVRATDPDTFVKPLKPTMIGAIPACENAADNKYFRDAYKKFEDAHLQPIAAIDAPMLRNVPPHV